MEAKPVDVLKTEADIAKLMAETMKLQAETSKLNSESVKLQREARFYPFIAGAAFLGAALALGKLFHP